MTQDSGKPTKNWKHGRCARCPNSAKSEKYDGKLYCVKYEKPAARVAWNCKKVV